MLATAITLNLETIVVILGILGVIFGWLSKLNAKENDFIQRFGKVNETIKGISTKTESELQRHKSENELEFYKLRSSFLMLKTHQENIEKYLAARQGYQPRKSGFTDADFLGEDNDATNY